MVLALVCFLAYANSLSGAFVWDDGTQVVKNWRIRELSNLPSAFTSAFWSFLGPSIEKQTNYYRPVQTVTYMIGYALGGLSPTWYHVLSLLFHFGACVFIYLASCELLPLAGAALLTASLFAAHPVHTEAVSWIAGVADVSCGTFYFGALWAFLEYRKRQKNSWLVWTCVFFLAALFSKEMAVTLPMLLCLLQAWHPKYREELGTNLKSILPLGAVFIIYLVARVMALGIVATSQMKVEASWLDWISLGAMVFAGYIRYSLAPYPLNAFHLLPVHLADRTLPTLLSAIVIVAVALSLFYLRKRFPDGLIWFAGFAVMLVPVLYFKGISYAFLAERYDYIPSFALMLLVVSLVTTFRVPYANAALWCVVAAFVLLTAYHNRVWASDEALYSATLQIQPEASHMRINLADIYLKRNDDATAKQHLDLALHYLDDQRFAQFNLERYRVHVGLGAIAARSGDFVNARQHFETALQIQPNGDWAYLYLGGVFAEADKDYPRAIENFEKAIEYGPLNEVARDYMGVAMLNQGKYEEAAKNFEEALKINPQYEDAKSHLALAVRGPTP